MCTNYLFYAFLFYRGLCDIKQIGKLNGEQFALAMWLVERCLKGQEPPVSLSPEMVPPSFRNNKAGDGHVVSNNIFLIFFFRKINRKAKYRNIPIITNISNNKI